METPTTPKVIAPPKTLRELLVAYWGRGDHNAPIHAIDKSDPDQARLVRIAICDAAWNENWGKAVYQSPDIGRAAVMMKITTAQNFKSTCSTCVENTLKQLKGYADNLRDQAARASQSASPAAEQPAKAPRMPVPQPGTFIFHVNPNTGCITPMMAVDGAGGGTISATSLCDRSKVEVLASEVCGTIWDAYSISNAIIQEKAAPDSESPKPRKKK